MQSSIDIFNQPIPSYHINPSGFFAAGSYLYDTISVKELEDHILKEEELDFLQAQLQENSV